LIALAHVKVWRILRRFCPSVYVRRTAAVRQNGFWATACKTVRPMLSDRCLFCPVCSVCNVGVLWPNGWADQDETWHAGRPRPWPHCVRWGPRSPSLKVVEPPKFSAHICFGQMARWIKMPLGIEVDHDPSDIVLHEDPTPCSQKGDRAPPQFSAHVYCGQISAWIKMPLGTMVGLVPGNIVLHGDPAPPPNRGTHPNFRLMFIASNGRPSQLLLSTC